MNETIGKLEYNSEGEEDLPRIEHLLNRMALIAEQHIGNRYGHIRRVGLISQHIALQIGFSTEEALIIGSASRLHDIGMVTVPADIVKKPGRLTPDEMGMVKRHTTEGLRLIGRKKDSLIQAARAVIGSHHERWDGSGYPEGLKADAIPLEAQIAAIADTFDALCCPRPDRKSLQPQTAIGVIATGSEGLFSPGIVKAFCDCKTDILHICNKIPPQR